MESKFKEGSNLPKVQIKSPDGVHGEVWIDGQKVRGVRRIDFSLDAEGKKTGLFYCNYNLTLILKHRTKSCCRNIKDWHINSPPFVLIVAQGREKE